MADAPTPPVQPQATPAQPVAKQAAPTGKRPVAVTIIAILAIIGGVFSLFGVLGIMLDVVLGIFALIVGALTLAGGIGLLKMKKWGLLAITIATALGFLQIGYLMMFVDNPLIVVTIWSYIPMLIQLLIVIYLWVIRKQFN